jgi:hypothetical protein
MAFLPPDRDTRRRARDKQREDDARRARVRFARDIGDEQTQAWAYEPRRKRSKFTLVTLSLLIAFAVLGAIPMFLHHGNGLLDPDCGRPAVEVGPTRIKPGGSFSWQAAGPETGSYVVVLDASTVTGEGTVDAGSVLAGPVTLTGCRSPQKVVDGPETAGTHEIALFRRTGSVWERVAVAPLTVS